MSVETALKNATGEAAAIAQLQEDVADLNGSKANMADIATEFSDLTNYNAGDLVYYEGNLYEFQVDHVAGSWETSEVIQKDLSDIVNTLKSGLMSLNSNVSNLGIYVGTVEFTFSNSTMSNNVVIQTATGGVVTSNNILGVSGVLLGDSGLFSLTSNKYQIGCEIPNAYTGTLTALVIFFYAN